MEFLLIWNKMPLHVLVLFVGVLYFSRQEFFIAWMNYLLAIFISRLLKVWFAVPLVYEGTSAEKFGFPSGHTYVSLAIYLWLLLAYPQKSLRFIFLCLSCGLSIAVVHFGYHTWMDVFGAWGFATLQTIAFFFALKKWPLLQRDPRFLTRFLLGISLLSLFYLGCKDYLHHGTWGAFYTVLGAWGASELYPSWLEGMIILWRVFWMRFFVMLSGVFLLNSAVKSFFIQVKPIFFVDMSDFLLSEMTYGLFSFLLIVVVSTSTRKV